MRCCSFPLWSPLKIGGTKALHTMLVRLLQSTKAPSPILVTELGMIMLFSLMHPSKALSPILVTELGMIMLLRQMQ